MSWKICHSLSIMKIHGAKFSNKKITAEPAVIFLKEIWEKHYLVRYIFIQNIKQVAFATCSCIGLGRKDLNPRNGGVRVHCLTAWRRPSLLIVFRPTTFILYHVLFYLSTHFIYFFYHFRYLLVFNKKRTTLYTKL